MEVFTNQVTYTLTKDAIYTSSVIREGYSDGLTSFAELQTQTANSRGQITIDLPPTGYDSWFSVEVHEGTDLTGDVVLLDTVTRTRQYASTTAILSYMQGKVNPTQATEYERIARHQINSIIGSSFGFEHKIVDFPGNGTDVLVLDERLGGKVFRIFENGEVIYDETDPLRNNFYRAGYSPYTLVMDEYDDFTTSGLVEGLAMEHGRTWSTRYLTPLFKENYDYRIDAEWGWKVVPQDIQDATLLLVNDIACGNNRYSTKYIDSFRNGSASVDYFKEVIKGTGNLIVDNILSKYTLESVRAKVL